MRFKRFIENIWMIFLLSVIGTIISFVIFLFAALLWGIFYHQNLAVPFQGGRLVMLIILPIIFGPAIAIYGFLKSSKDRTL